MKTNHLPAIVISLTLVIGINLWAIERDRVMFDRVCIEENLYCE